ncbi:hypothetical protein BJX99DRAFT_108736 [Aspergillus californicus]
MSNCPACPYSRLRVELKSSYHSFRVLKLNTILYISRGHAPPFGQLHQSQRCQPLQRIVMRTIHMHHLCRLSSKIARYCADRSERVCVCLPFLVCCSYNVEKCRDVRVSRKVVAAGNAGHTAD